MLSGVKRTRLDSLIDREGTLNNHINVIFVILGSCLGKFGLLDASHVASDARFC